MGAKKLGTAAARPKRRLQRSGLRAAGTMLTLAALMGCELQDDTLVDTDGGGGSGGTSDATSVVATTTTGGGGMLATSSTTTGGGGGPSVPEGVPMFVAQGHIERTAVSCNGGQSWSNDDSLDDSLRCFNGMLDCNHRSDTARGLTYGNGYFVATYGWGQPGRVRRSRNGVDWETVAEGTRLSGVAFGRNTFVGGGYKVWRSEGDASSWQTIADGADSVVRRTVFVDVGPGLFVMAADAAIWVSDDTGLTWKKSQAPESCSSNLMFRGGVAGGNGTVLVLNATGESCVSNDNGATFVPAATTPSSVSSDLLWTDGAFVAWGSNKRFRSVDGLSWTSEAITQGVQPRAVAQGANGEFVALSYAKWSYTSHAFYRSDDGINWIALGASQAQPGHPIFDLVFGYGDQESACL